MKKTNDSIYTEMEKNDARAEVRESVRILLGIGLTLAIFVIAKNSSPSVNFWILSVISAVTLVAWLKTRSSLLGMMSVTAAFFAVGIGLLEALRL